MRIHGRFIARRASIAEKRHTRRENNGVVWCSPLLCASPLWRYATTRYVIGSNSMCFGCTRARLTTQIHTEKVQHIFRIYYETNMGLVVHPRTRLRCEMCVCMYTPCAWRARLPHVYCIQCTIYTIYTEQLKRNGCAVYKRVVRATARRTSADRGSCMRGHQSIVKFIFVDNRTMRLVLH